MLKNILDFYTYNVPILNVNSFIFFNTGVDTQFVYQNHHGYAMGTISSPGFDDGAYPNNFKENVRILEIRNWLLYKFYQDNI